MEKGIKAALAFVLSLWAALPQAVTVLVWLMAFDMVSGVLAGFVTKKLSSTIGSRGIAKKALAFVLIGAVGIVTKPLSLPLDLPTTIAWFFVANEFISIAENCARAGLPIPKQLKESLAKVAGQYQE